jgi:hypothetical protein
MSLLQRVRQLCVKHPLDEFAGTGRIEAFSTAPSSDAPLNSYRFLFIQTFIGNFPDFIGTLYWVENPI